MRFQPSRSLGMWAFRWGPFTTRTGVGSAGLVGMIVSFGAETVRVMANRDDHVSSDLRAIFERLDQGFCICELVCDRRGVAVDYRFVEVNAQFEEMTGLVGAQGRTAHELVPGLESSWVDMYARVALGKETVRFQQRSDVMGRWFDVFATPLDAPRQFAIVFRDDSARKAAESALERSVERFRAMADDLPLVVWVHGPDGEQQFVNHTFCEFFGVDRDRMIADEWQPLLHPDDSDGYVDGFLAAVRERAPFHHRARVHNAEGQWRWMESWARPRFDADGAFLGHIGTSADVTDQVMVEAAREEATLFLRNVLDSLFTFVGVLTPDGTLTDVNTAPLVIAGITHDDVIGKKFWDCYWWSYDAAVMRRLADAVRRAYDGEVVRHDARIRVADGGWRWIDFQLVPLRDANGTTTHLIPSGLDITDRLEAERERAALMESERMRRARAELLESNASGLASAMSTNDVASVVLQLLQESLGHDLAAINLVRDGPLQIVTARGVHPDALTEPIAVTAHLPGPLAIATNNVVHLTTAEEIVNRFPGLVDTTSRYLLQTILAVPLRAANGFALGALVIGAPDPNAFDAEHLRLLEDIGAQTGQALQRALLHEQLVAAHERERATAVRLQRALLPDRVVDDARVRIAARYEAGDAHLEVGGDWYDTHQWPDGRIGILVGDVVGHDLEAAAAMGRIRSATGALAETIDATPIAMLDALEYVAHGPGGTDFVTAVALVIDPATGHVAYALAGHPPPLLLGDNHTGWLDQALGPPIGIITGPQRRFATIKLTPGDCIVLYTDGLIERRGRALDDSLEDLIVASRRHGTQVSPEALLDGLIAELGADRGRDDIVAVAAQWLPPA